MAERLYILPISSDAAVVKLSRIAEEKFKDFQVRLTVSSIVPHVHVTYTGVGSECSQDSELKGFLSKLKELGNVPCQQARLEVLPPGSNFNEMPHANNAAKVIFQDVEQGAYFTFDGNDNPPGIHLQLFAGLQAQFNVSTRHTIVSESLPPAYGHLLRSSESTVSALVAEVERLGVYLTSMSKENDKFLKDRVSECEAKFADRTRELENEFQAKRKSLEEKERDLERTRKALDDRSSKHVRRDLLTKMKENVTERKSTNALSKSTMRSRTVVHVTSIVFLIFFGSMMGSAFWTLLHDLKNTQFDWRFFPPMSVSTLLFAGTLIFYMRWLAKWTDQAIHEDLAVGQYASDIMRASWIAELLFEYKDEKGQGLSSDVLQRLTEGLFRSEAFQPGNYHPADHMFKAFNNIKKVRLGDVEVQR